MNNVLKSISVILILTLVVLMPSCKDKKSTASTLTIRQMADPDMLNPINSSSDNGRMISDLIFSSINSMELKCEYDLVPFLTKNLGVMTEVNEGEFAGGMKIEYEIREEAKWDNGEPITARDYVFTLKTILNPNVNNEHLKSYYDWVGDVEIDLNNPKKFTVYAQNRYFKIEEFAGYFILPEYNYDPGKIMQKFNLKDMNTQAKRDALKSNPDMVKFATDFNSEKYQRDPKFISGCGPYKLASWTTGQELVLEKKENWWGDKFKDDRQFWAFPKKIKFKIINDQSTAITALKDDALDAFPSLPSKEYNELTGNEEFKAKFRMDKKDILAYTFLYFNLRNEKFQDIKVREALARAVNRQKINETLNNNENVLTESFVHPSQKTYNKNLKPFEFDLVLANKLLDEAGWIDTDGDGIRDRVINGRSVPLTIEFKYNAGNEQRKNTALIIQEDFVKIGVGLSIVAKEWSVFLQELDKLNFEMSYGGFTVPPRISDPKQTWHTSNAVPGADNKSGWGNQESDQIIDEIGVTLDFEKRKALYMQLQQMIHDDIPVIYLFAPKNRMALSRRYDVEFNLVSPGFMLNEFKIAN